MKKRTMMILVLLLAGLLWVVTAQADPAVVASGSCGENLTWEKNGTVLTISGTGRMDDYGEYEDNGDGTLTITAAPWGTDITKAIVGSGVTTIGNNAFRDCRNLTDVSLPDTLTGIGAGAFTWCAALESIDIPDSVVTIGNAAFFNCSGLQNVTLPSGLTEISSQLFDYCHSLTGVQMPETITQIGDYAFGHCESLASINIPRDTAEINSLAFYHCYGLNTITVSDGNTAFVVEDGVLFNSSKTCIYACSHAMTGVYTIPEGVERIDSDFFAGCTGITKIIIPQSLRYIHIFGDAPFAGCSNLAAFEVVNEESDYFKAIGGVLFYGMEGHCNLLCYPAAKAETSYTVPDHTVYILDGAFHGCSHLTSITVPETVQSIGEGAFAGCSGLTYISLPHTGIKIDTNAFIDCCGGCRLNPLYDTDGILTGLELSDCDDSAVSCTIPSGVIRIGNEAFCDCYDLSEVTIPDSVTEIGCYAFGDCGSLPAITIPDGVRTVEQGAFDDWEGTIYCSLGSDGAKALGAAGYGFVDPDHPELIYRYLAGNGTEILAVAGRNLPATEISIPAGVSVICPEAFSGLTDITGVTMTDEVTEIQAKAFCGCSALAEIRLSANLAKIGERAFEGCSSLEKLTIPDSLSSIGNNALPIARLVLYANIGSTGAKTVSRYGTYGWPFRVEGEKYGLQYTFSGSAETGLRLSYADADITVCEVPAGVTEIGGYAFEDCTSLTSVTIPEGVRSIKEYAFYNCSALEEVRIPGTVSEIGPGVFSGVVSADCIVLPANHAYLLMENGVLFTKNKNRLIRYFPSNTAAAYTVPGAVRTIDEDAFEGAANLKKLTVSEGVTTMGEQYSETITELSLPKTLTDENLYIRMPLTKLTISGNNPAWKCENGCLVYLPDAEMTQYFSGINSSHHLVIPDGVARIQGGTISYDYKLTSIDIPDGVREIGYMAFDALPLLRKIRIAASVTQIDVQCVQKHTVVYCYADTEAERWAQSEGLQTVLLDNASWSADSCQIVLPEGLRKVEAESLMGTAGDSYYIPFGVTAIGSRAFAGLSAGRAVIMLPSTVNPDSIADDAFQGSNVLLIIGWRDYEEWERVGSLMTWAENHGIDSEEMAVFGGNG